jgi:TRAP-type C4-dicarboxylate transport system substrate-binding protein
LHGGELRILRRIFFLIFIFVLTAFAACTAEPDLIGEDTGVLPGNEGEAFHELPELPPPTPEPSRIFTFHAVPLDDKTVLKFAELIDELTKGDWKVIISDSPEFDFTRVSADVFDSYDSKSNLFELSRFDDNVIVTSVDLWNGMSPYEQSVIMQCALEAAFDFNSVN